MRWTHLTSNGAGRPGGGPSRPNRLQVARARWMMAYGHLRAPLTTPPTRMATWSTRSRAGVGTSCFTSPHVPTSATGRRSSARPIPSTAPTPLLSLTGGHSSVAARLPRVARLGAPAVKLYWGSGHDRDFVEREPGSGAGVQGGPVRVLQRAELCQRGSREAARLLTSPISPTEYLTQKFPAVIVLPGLAASSILSVIQNPM
jgi:hypothetical protein